jgi:aspartate/methionine/tyrosine aminotransferase
MSIEVESPEQHGYGRIACNLSESSVSDRRLSQLDLSLGDLVLCYGEHAGKRPLRERIAAEGEGLSPDDVLVTAGAAAALFIVATALLEPRDRIVVVRPNYATNVETPRAIGADVATLDLRFEDRWALDLDRLAALVTPRTRLVSLTSPHNPTGRVVPDEDLERVLALCESRGAHLLLDETYREMDFRGPRPLLASRSDRVISVSSLSKTYGLPGIRLGWLACRDRALMETFLAAKEQIFITCSVLDEEVALRALERKERLLPEIRAGIVRGLAAVRAFMARERRLEWVEPEGGVVCFPRIRADARVDVDGFYGTLMDDLKTWVGPGHWFEQDRRHFRIGYGWPSEEELQRGLANISTALDRSVRGRETAG